MKTTLIMVRHGESVDNAARRFGGRRDVGLTDTGNVQAQAVAHGLSRKKIDVVVSSTLARARQTAKQIAAPHGLPVEIQEGFEEANFGLWEGMTYAEIQSAYPDFASQWIDMPLTIPPPEGESFEAVCLRVKIAMEALYKRWRGKQIVLVAHGGSIRAAIVHAIRGPIHLAAHMAIDPCSITIVDDFHGHGVIRTLNSKAGA